MRETATPDPTLAADEALEYAREAERLHESLDDLYRNHAEKRDLIGRAQHRLGVALKLAGVHSQLAVAEEVRALRADLAPVLADWLTVPEIARQSEAVESARVVHLESKAAEVYV